MRQSLEEILMAFFMEHESECFFVQEISEHFGFTASKDFKILVKQLADLEDSGKIVLTRQGKFGFNQKNRTLEGTFRLNDKGFGFVTVEEGKPDIFIPRTDVHGAMDGDTVAIRIVQEENPYNDKAASGTIVKIIERAVKQVVGIYTRYPSKIMMQTGYCGEIALKDSKLKKTKCYVTRKGLNPVDGTVVIAEVDSYETERHELVLKAHIVKEIGYKDAVGMDILMILHQLKIPTVFPDTVIEEANRVSETISPAELEGRVDLRQELTVTIDGADAKDLDDAVALVKREDGTFVLTVSIADVSYYVTENSEMDKEAFERGTSVYLTDRVVPMLPQRLSNGICSLHPYEERLTLTARMEIDRSGTIYQHEIFPSVIQSNERLTYDEVNVLSEIGWLYNYMGKYEDALPFLLKAQELGRNDEGINTEIAVSLGRSGNVKEAIEKLKKSLTMVDQNDINQRIFINSELGWYYGKLENPEPEEGLKYLNIAKELGRDDEWIHSEIGYQLGYNPEARKESLEHFDRAIELGRNDAWIFEVRGAVLLDLKRYQEALDSFKNAYDLNNDGWYLYCMGRCLRGLERYEEAIEVLLKSRQISLDEEDVVDGEVFELASCYVGIGDKENAQKYLDSARDSITERGLLNDYTKEKIEEIEKEILSLDKLFN